MHLYNPLNDYINTKMFNAKYSDIFSEYFICAIKQNKKNTPIKHDYIKDDVEVNFK